MIKNFYIYPICVILFFAGIFVFVWAAKHLFQNNELLSYTPKHDEENVMLKHKRIWIKAGILIFCLPFAFMICELLFAKFADDKTYEIYHMISMQPFVPIAICVISLVASVKFRASTFFDAPYVITRYMVYPAPFELSVITTTLNVGVASVLTMVLRVIFASEATMVYVLGDISNYALLFVCEILIVFFANYAIIRAFYNTPREIVLNEVAESDYDKAAKRYYGIWRNRLILANAAAGAQLVLGGFATLTNAGVHLAGVRYLGIVVLVIVFSYILIQSRDFDAPIIVKGMVYPSEKKRITLNRIVLASVIVYIIGAIILL